VRSLVAVLALVSTLLACSTSGSPAPTSGPGSSAALPTGGAGAPASVLVSLDWIIGGQHSAFYVAVEKGFYAEQNLSVTVVRGYGSGDTVKRIAAKGADIGFADIGPLISAKASDNVPVKAISVIYNDAPHAIFFNKKSGITSPKDLEGKTLSDSASSAIRLMWPVFAAANNIDQSKVEWKIVDPAAVNPAFLSGSADGIGQFTISSIGLRKEAEKAGIEMGRLRYVDHGVKIYSNAIIANDDVIKEKPDVLRRFVAATLKGYEYALANQEEAVAIYGKYQRDPPAENVTEELKLVDELVNTAETKANGIGTIDEKRMADTVTAITKALGVPDIDTRQVYTNEFLP
jgi:NitT/TauT family transport system substrate-binding protein